MLYGHKLDTITDVYEKILNAVMRITVTSSFWIAAESRKIYIFLNKWLKLKRNGFL